MTYRVCLDSPELLDIVIISENEWKEKEFLMNVFEESKLKHVMALEIQEVQETVHVIIAQEIVMIQDQPMVIQDHDMNKGKIKK